MYTSYFGLNDKPFSITPDPRYLFLSERHGEALAHLVYGVTESGGFVQLTGEVGTGKTTLVRSLLQSRLPVNADVAVVLNPRLTPTEFLTAICEELEIDVPAGTGSGKQLVDALNRYLLAAHADGRRVILIVDEAQNLAADVLEQVRLLTNLETARQKLLQIILIGQPELRDLLARRDLRQLAQRITGRYHLEPLSRDETAQYIDHRLQVAGAVGELFDTGARREVFRHSGGIPRLINVICDRALLGAYAGESRRVTRRLVRRAAREIAGGDTQDGVSRRWLPVAAVAGVAIVGITAATVAVLLVRDGLPWQQPAAIASAPAAAHSPELSPDLSPGQSRTEPASEGPTGSPAGSDLTAAAETAAPTAASAAEPAPTLAERLALAADLTGPGTALAALFAAWNLPPPLSGDCETAAPAGFACLELRGSFANLRQLDRPAILRLVAADGTRHDVVLMRVDGNDAELSIGGASTRHSLAEIDALWFGDAELLWQPPDGDATSLLPGVRSAKVRWLRRSLAEIDPELRSEPLESSAYDAALVATVRRFQQAQRLEVDGYAGAQTQIIIRNLQGAGDAPRLLQPGLARAGE